LLSHHTTLTSLAEPLLAIGMQPHLSWRWLIIGVAAALFARFLLPRSKTSVSQLGRELAIVVPAYLAYSAVRHVAQGRASDAFHHAGLIITLEREIGIFWEQQLQQRVIDLEMLVTAMNWIYIWGFWPVIVLAAVWLFVMHRDSYGVYRNAFLISGAIGLIVFATFPVAPPRYMLAWGFVDTVALQSHASMVLQDPAFVNQFAAMPSLHFGWIVLVAIAAVRHGSGLFPKVFGILVPAAMLASIVLTANHYIIDGIAGGCLALLGLALAWLLARRFDHAGVATSPPAHAALA
jgi:membrane-associated phospholipid phosphatase